MPIPTWQPGTLYQPGDLVKPTSSGVITPPALLNPSFEDGFGVGIRPADWTVLFETNGLISAKNNAPTFDGTWAMEIFANENSTCQVINDERIPCVPGDLVTFRAYCQWVTGDDPRFSWLQLSIRWFTDALVELEPTIAYQLGSTEANGQSAQSVWAQRTISGIAPAAAAFCTLRFDATSDDSDVATWRVDAVTIDFAAQAPPNPFLFRAVQSAAGFSGSSEPTWPTVLGNQVVDNEVTWQAVPSSGVTWEASRILVSGAVEPTWPLVVGGSVLDNTIGWQLDSRRVTDELVPSDSSVVLLASSKVFAADGDIIRYSATVNPLDWSTRQDAGYIGFGLQQYGNNPVRAMGLYRGNLAAFNSQGCQLWQLDEDPAGITYLDAIPVACTFPKSVQPVGDDLALLSNLGIRSLGLTGAAVNLQGGYFGQQVDPLVETLLAAAIADDYDPLGLYWPARGQYWLFFGSEALVLTINAGPDEKPKRSWSRYTFPSAISDWTIQGEDLVLRSGDLVWIVDPETLVDDQVGEVLELEAGEDELGVQAIHGYMGAALNAALGGSGAQVGSIDSAVFAGVTLRGLWVNFDAVTEAYGNVSLVLSGASMPANDVFGSLVLDGVTLEAAAATVTTGGSLPANHKRWTWAAPGVELEVGETYSTAEGVGFEGVIQWPFLDMKTPGRDKEMIGFDLVIEGDAEISIGYNQRELEYDAGGSWTAPYEVNGDTLPADMVPYSVTGPTLSLRLAFRPNQAWKWYSANLYIKDLT